MPPCLSRAWSLSASHRLGAHPPLHMSCSNFSQLSQARSLCTGFLIISASVVPPPSITLQSFRPLLTLLLYTLPSMVPTKGVHTDSTLDPQHLGTCLSQRDGGAQAMVAQGPSVRMTPSAYLPGRASSETRRRLHAGQETRFLARCCCLLAV